MPDLLFNFSNSSQCGADTVRRFRHISIQVISVFRCFDWALAQYNLNLRDQHLELALHSCCPFFRAVGIMSYLVLTVREWLWDDEVQRLTIRVKSHALGWPDLNLTWVLHKEIRMKQLVVSRLEKASGYS